MPELIGSFEGRSVDAQRRDGSLETQPETRPRNPRNVEISTTTNTHGNLGRHEAGHAANVGKPLARELPTSRSFRYSVRIATATKLPAVLIANYSPGEKLTREVPGKAVGFGPINNP